MLKTVSAPFLLRRYLSTANLAGSPNTITNTGLYVLQSWSRDGVVLPGYRDRIFFHESATTRYTRVFKQVIKFKPAEASFDFYIVDAGKRYFKQDYLFGTVTFTMSWGSLPSRDMPTVSAALASFYKAARSKQVTFQGGVFLGELRETVHLIRNPMESILSGCRTYQRLVKRRVARSHKRDRQRIIGETWLEVAFGWRPLLSDIDDAVRYLADQARDPRRSSAYVRVSGKAKRESASSPLVTSTSAANYLRFLVTTFQKDSFECMYYGEVSATVPGLSHAEVTKVGLDPTNLAPTLWELVPWSFLVDYFTNLGDLINALSFSNASVRWVARSERFEVTTNIVGAPDLASMRKLASPPNPNADGDHIISASGKSSHRQLNRYRRIERYPMTPSELGVPNFQFKVPGVGTKWLNIAALVATNALPGLDPYRGRSRSLRF